MFLGTRSSSMAAGSAIEAEAMAALEDSQSKEDCHMFSPFCFIALYLLSRCMFLCPMKSAKFLTEQKIQ